MTSKPILVLGAIAGAVTATVLLVRRTAAIVRRLGHLLDDLIGEEERPGVKARPGLMERMAAVEAAARAAQHNTEPNGGQSPHDKQMQEIRGLHDSIDALRRDAAERDRQWLEHLAWTRATIDRAAEQGFDGPPLPPHLSPPEIEERS